MTWQPIETAPKDGTQVLVFSSKDGQEVVCFEKLNGLWYTTGEYAMRAVTHWMHLPAPPGQGQAAESYRQANPLGGPAKVFDAIADAIRAGDPVDQAMREFGVCWQEAPEARMLTEAEVESTLDEAKVPEYPNCDDIDQQIAAVIQRRFCEVNGISLSGAKAADKGESK